MISVPGDYNGLTRVPAEGLDLHWLQSWQWLKVFDISCLEVSLLSSHPIRQSSHLQSIHRFYGKTNFDSFSIYSIPGNHC